MASIEKTKRKLQECIKECLKIQLRPREFQKRADTVLEALYVEAVKPDEEEQINFYKDLEPDRRRELWENLGSAADKEKLATFLLDCVIKNIRLWSKVIDIKELFSEEPGWAAAFDEVMRHEPYASTDFERTDFIDPDEDPNAERPLRPIPFWVELLFIAGVSLPFCASTQRCECARRWSLVQEMIFACMAWPLLEILLKFQKSRNGILNWLARGEYGFGISYRNLPPVYWPSFGYQPDPRSILCLEKPDKSKKGAGKGNAAGAAGAPGQKDMSGKGSAGAKKFAKAKAAPFKVEFAGDKKEKDDDIEWVDQGLSLYTWGVWANSRPLKSKAEITRGAYRETTEGRFSLLFYCKDWGWENGDRADVAMTEDNPGRGVFNGECWFFERPGGKRRVWVKIGIWRLDILRKIALCLIAGFLPQGFDAMYYDIGLCGFSGTIPSTAVPLRSVFLLDASNMNDTEEAAERWAMQKSATEEIIRGLDSEYPVIAGSPRTYYVGVGQYGAQSYTDIEMTRDLNSVYRRLPQVQHRCASNEEVDCSPSIRAALQESNTMLLRRANLPESIESYDLAVLLTAGEEGFDVANPYHVLDNDTNILAIYVGTDEIARDQVRRFVCDNRTECTRFAEAESFESLRGRGREVASGIAAISTNVRADQECFFPVETLWSLLFTLPFLTLWCRRVPVKQKLEEDVEIGGSSSRLSTPMLGSGTSKSMVGVGTSPPGSPRDRTASNLASPRDRAATGADG